MRRRRVQRRVRAAAYPPLPAPSPPPDGGWESGCWWLHQKARGSEFSEDLKVEENKWRTSTLLLFCRASFDIDQKFEITSNSTQCKIMMFINIPIPKFGFGLVKDILPFFEQPCLKRKHVSWRGRCNFTQDANACLFLTHSCHMKSIFSQGCWVSLCTWEWSLTYEVEEDDPPVCGWRGGWPGLGFAQEGRWDSITHTLPNQLYHTKSSGSTRENQF